MVAVCLNWAEASADEGRVLVPLTRTCIERAADAFGHPRMALGLILKQEGGRVGQCVGPNGNGTYDCGPGQVNTSEIRLLAPILGIPYEKAFLHVRDNGCFNVLVSSYILAKKKKAANGNLWDAMGRYNSATPGIKERYQGALVQQFRRLMEFRQ